MDSDWASDHLQVIRTLMERAAVYRRALAPIMLSVGAIGIAASAAGYFTGRFDTNRGFAGLWVGTALLSVAAALLLVRRQALKESEPFWSPPTRRVTQALVPGFLAGALAGALVIIAGEQLGPVAWLLSIGWTIAYGCALHAAGFFMERGIKLFGLVITAVSSVLLILMSLVPTFQTAKAAHLVMGLFFGALHLAYGGYLHVTERRVKS